MDQEGWPDDGFKDADGSLGKVGGVLEEVDQSTDETHSVNSVWRTGVFHRLMILNNSN